MTLPILCYHRVSRLRESGRRLNIETETLGSHLDLFMRRGFRFASASELHGAWPDRTVCITFDDGYVSTLTHGVEELRRRNAVATIFVCPGFVGAFASWEGGGGEPLADWALLRSASQYGIEIANHTLSHEALDLLEGDQRRVEIAEAKRQLEGHDLPHGSFAYPYGRHGAEALSDVQGQGYRVGLGLGRRPARATDDRLLLPRIVVAYGDAPLKLLYKLYIRPCLPSTRARKHYVR
jgi:peptidoglycan/xylan/chitin deacetylase (PgdA/CDA1 family)